MASKIYFPKSDKEKGGKLKKTRKFGVQDIVIQRKPIETNEGIVEAPKIRPEELRRDITPESIKEEEERKYREYLEHPERFEGYSIGALEKLQKEARKFEKEKEKETGKKKPELRPVASRPRDPAYTPVIFPLPDGRESVIPHPDDTDDDKIEFIIRELLADEPRLAEAKYTKSSSALEEFNEKADRLFKRFFNKALPVKITAKRLKSAIKNYKDNLTGHGLKFTKGKVIKTSHYLDPNSNDKEVKRHLIKALKLAKKQQMKGKLSKPEHLRLETYKKCAGAGFFDKVWSGIKGVASKAVDVGKKVVDIIPDDVKSKIKDKAMDIGKAQAQKLGQKVLTKIGGGNIVIDAVNRMADSARDIIHSHLSELLKSLEK